MKGLALVAAALGVALISGADAASAQSTNGSGQGQRVLPEYAKSLPHRHSLPASIEVNNLSPNHVIFHNPSPEVIRLLREDARRANFIDRESLR